MSYRLVSRLIFRFLISTLFWLPSFSTDGITLHWRFVYVHIWAHSGDKITLLSPLFNLHSLFLSGFFFSSFLLNLSVYRKKCVPWVNKRTETKRKWENEKRGKTNETALKRAFLFIWREKSMWYIWTSVEPGKCYTLRKFRFHAIAYMSNILLNAFLFPVLSIVLCPMPKFLFHIPVGG